MFQKHLSCMVSGSKLEETYPAGPSNSQENFLGNQSLLLVCTLQPTQNQLEPCLAWCGLITGWRVQAVKCLRVEESLDCGCGHISPFPLGRTGGNKATATSPPLPFLWYSVQKRLVWARNLERGIFVKVKDFREVSIVHHSNYWWKAVIRDGATQHSTAHSCTPRGINIAFSSAFIFVHGGMALIIIWRRLEKIQSKVQYLNHWF